MDNQNMEEKKQEARKELNQFDHFMIGAIAGGIMEIFLPREITGETKGMLIDSLGVAVGSQLRKYSSIEKRLNSAAASYAGAFASQALCNIVKNYFS